MHMICRHGVPDQILTDQGGNFEGELTCELCDLLDVYKTRTAPYHPQCDGLTERVNRTIQIMIASYINEKQKDWQNLLHYVAFAYNTSVHSTTNCSPFEVVYGRQPKVPGDLIFEEPALGIFTNPQSYADQVKLNLKSAYKLVEENRDLIMDKAKIRHDRVLHPANFSINDYVWLRDTEKKPGKTLKFSRRWKGPYQIISKLNDANYFLKPLQPKGRKIVANQERLKKAFEQKVEFPFKSNEEQNKKEDIQVHSQQSNVQRNRKNSTISSEQSSKQSNDVISKQNRLISNSNKSDATSNSSSFKSTKYSSSVNKASVEQPGTSKSFKKTK